jgi:hypothetical protein
MSSDPERLSGLDLAAVAVGLQVLVVVTARIRIQKPFSAEATAANVRGVLDA